MTFSQRRCRALLKLLLICLVVTWMLMFFAAFRLHGTEIQHDVIKASSSSSSSTTGSLGSQRHPRRPPPPLPPPSISTLSHEQDAGHRGNHSPPKKNDNHHAASPPISHPVTPKPSGSPTHQPTATSSTNSPTFQELKPAKNNLATNATVAHHDGKILQQQQQPITKNMTAGKEPILKILESTVVVGELNLTNEQVAALPKWSDILDMYGPEPKIYGLEHCQKFRDAVNETDRLLGVGGSFNSGTNLLHSVISGNCNNLKSSRPSTKGILWQVPWGKHFPASMRLKHFSHRYLEFPQTSVFPVIAIRDPYRWLKAMCTQPYNAHFSHGRTPGLCPNLIPYKHDIKADPYYRKVKYMPVKVAYNASMKIPHTSLAHLWNDWYRDYFDGVDYPRLIVRMEDVIYHGEEVTRKICDCVGFTMNPLGFTHTSEKMNQNRGIDLTDQTNGLMNAIIKYVNKTSRREGYPDFQLEAAHDILDPELMDYFGYSYEPFVPNTTED